MVGTVNLFFITFNFKTRHFFTIIHTANKASFICYVRKSFRKTNMSYSLIRTRTWACQGAHVWFKLDRSNLSLCSKVIVNIRFWNFCVSEGFCKICNIFRSALKHLWIQHDIKLLWKKVTFLLKKFTFRLYHKSIFKAIVNNTLFNLIIWYNNCDTNH